MGSDRRTFIENVTYPNGNQRTEFRRVTAYFQGYQKGISGLCVLYTEMLV